LCFKIATQGFTLLAMTEGLRPLKMWHRLSSLCIYIKNGLESPFHIIPDAEVVSPITHYSPLSQAVS